MATISYLLLGSNLGSKQLNLEQARTLLSLQAGNITKQSAVYQTLAWGNTDQPAFLNQVLEIQTDLSPQMLLQKINEIEKNLGRERRARWESRLIDIDILYFNTLVVETEVLIIPHPQIAYRRFTLVPLAEIAPDYIHPVLQQTNLQLLQNCPDTLDVRVVT
ncbi:2-amino-4-hydroxy-6-hydroxymethyldihydropteridine diphosphokinase [Rhodocytophaga rosea]|uniref:2-amino-4-hydroxy-6-hydroxymethyldihydropteridine pyrophosphokinase n=1 Tax=Rhodocytophaga rosea TaxID=2704465 RepID=A0A6C0GFC7_9BACT|nr:2-amino-4-hydroxy-6-hydroxymethyldihydropteridine diphosphokinase [Rhodocytophaga rosea]QHT66514.1 2-amino-4-hydroxy-6-hydroxymethyldihydropteridine diphosphokinase [Rhodocytophaga rosea]